MQVDPRKYLSDRRQKQKKRRKYFWSVAIFLAVYFVLLGIFIFIVRLPAFQASEIKIEGESAVSQTDVMNLLEASIINQNSSLTAAHSGLKALLGFKNMLIWPDALSTSTLAIIPRLAGITISKDYLFHTITVVVTERQPFAVWCLMNAAPSAGGGEQCFWFDNQGVAFESTLETQGGAIFIIHDYTQHKLAVNQPVLSDDFVHNLVSIVTVLKESGLQIKEIALNNISLQQIDVTLESGPALHFSLRFPATDDAPVLKSLIEKPGFDKLQYVDFTVENRAYYR